MLNKRDRVLDLIRESTTKQSGEEYLRQSHKDWGTVKTLGRMCSRLRSSA